MLRRDLVSSGRVVDGASAATVGAEMQSLHPPHWADAEPGDNSGTAVRQVRGKYQSGVDQQFMSLLMIVAGVHFLVCCANLARLLISRGRARTAELAVRAPPRERRGPGPCASC